MKACSPSLLGPARLAGPDQGRELSEGPPAPPAPGATVGPFPACPEGGLGRSGSFPPAFPAMCLASGLGLPPDFQPRIEHHTKLWGLPSCLVPSPAQGPGSLPVPTLWSKVYLNKGVARLTTDRRPVPLPAGPAPCAPGPWHRRALSSGARLLPSPPPPAHPTESRGPASRRVSQRELPCVYGNVDI